MPSIIGSIQVVNVGGGVINFGDSLNIAPKNVSKSHSGAGAANTGGFIITNNGISFNNAIDPDVSDQASVGNL